MTIDEDRDPELRQSLSEAIGEPQADRLMTLLPDRPMSELATRDDLADVKVDVAELRSGFGELRRDFGELRGEFADLKDDFRKIEVKFAEMKADVAEQILRYTLALGSLITVVLCTILGVGLTGGFA